MNRSAPDFQARVYTPHRIAAVVATLAEDGVAPAHVLAGSGIDEAALHSPDTRVSNDQIAAVFRNALRLAPDPTIALRAGARMRITSYGMYGYALLSSPNAAAAADFSVRYHAVAAPGMKMAFSREGERAAYRYEVLLTNDPGDALYRFMIEFSFSAHLALARDLYDRSYGFTAVCTAYPAPAHAAAYRMLFRCPVLFDQAVNELQLEPARLDRLPRSPDASTHAIAREMCQQLLGDLMHRTGTASMVRRALMEQMPWRFPNLEAMAAEMSVDARTLRRKLEAQGTSYRDIVAEVRRALAIEYLRKTRMTNEEIASRLGYSDAANFRHAFLRWTGKTPRDYRQA